jgi:hypothetical protein
MTAIVLNLDSVICLTAKTQIYFLDRILSEHQLMLMSNPRL